MSARRGALPLALLVAAMFAFAFALVPLYDAFCRLTGVNGRLDLAATAPAGGGPARELTVQFVTNVQGHLPWRFRPLARQLRVRTGEYVDVSFEVENLSDRAGFARAVANLMPGPAAAHVHKAQCFCFDAQALGAGERRVLHLRFLVDPDLPQRYRTLTLAYTFVEPASAAPGKGS